MIKTKRSLKAITLGGIHFDFSRPYIMGVLNLTPDSFSDGGLYLDPCHALKRAELLIKEGADIIDVGAESSRPGAHEISEEEESKRLKPFLNNYKKHFKIPLSLDTTKSHIALLGLDNGVSLINDISGLTADSNMAGSIASYKVPVVVMHRAGPSAVMQSRLNYTNVMETIYEELQQSIDRARRVGIKDVIIDPGIGFGKSLAHNMTILNELNDFSKLKCPLLIGTSRKSFIGEIDPSDVSERLGGTISSSIYAVDRGAHFCRVHDVGAVKQSLLVWQALKKDTVL